MNQSLEPHTLYTQAYKLHYSKSNGTDNVVAAERLYESIIKRFPDSDEAGYATSQLRILATERKSSTSSAAGGKSEKKAPKPAGGKKDAASSASPKPSPLIGIDAASLYKLAYNAHWKQKDLGRAEQLYTDVLTRFPSSNEASYAQTQLENLAGAQQRRSSTDGVGGSSAFSSSTDSIYKQTMRNASAQSKLESKRLDDLRSMVTTAASINEPHAIVRPIRVIAPVLNDPDSSKARLVAFDAAVVWLAQKTLEVGANLVIGARFEEVVASYSPASGSNSLRREKLEIVATGTAVRLITELPRTNK